MKKICLFVSTLLFSACATKVTSLQPTDFEQVIAQEDVTLIDVRTEKEYADGHINQAVNIDWRSDDFAAKADSLLDKSKTIAIYCLAGRRSHAAAGKLRSMGFTRLVELDGGIEAWKKEGKPIVADGYEIDEFSTLSGKKVRLHALMHASIRLEYDGKEFEIDPCRQLGNRSVDYTTLPKADYAIVTHEHHDHFDPEALRLLTAENTQLVMNARCIELYGDGQAMHNGDSMRLADNITLRAVPAYNTTVEHLQFHPKGRDNGYILTLDGLRIYFAGDTEDIPEMAEIQNIDIAFLPCNQPYTMTPKQLIKAAKIIHPKVLFPYHYGQTDVSGIPAALADENIDVRIRHYE